MKQKYLENSDLEKSNDPYFYLMKKFKHTNSLDAFQSAKAYISNFKDIFLENKQKINTMEMMNRKLNFINRLSNYIA